MITQMQNLTDAEHAILNQTWRGKKILSYLQAYGFDYEFCRSFRLTEGEKTGWMLLFNATLMICAEKPVALEETKTFVEMHLPFRIECPASFLPTLVTLPNYQKLRRTMFVLTPQPVSEEFQPEAVQKQPDLTAVYQILHEGFPNLLSYPLWLTDTSHRCRHGISQVLTYRDSTTVTILFDIENHVLVGQVATAVLLLVAADTPEIFCTGWQTSCNNRENMRSCMRWIFASAFTRKSGLKLRTPNGS